MRVTSVYNTVMHDIYIVCKPSDDLVGGKVTWHLGMDVLQNCLFALLGSVL
jgi:hypothetical protein